MWKLNNYICSGRLTKDAETNQTGSVCNFTVAVDNSVKDKNGEWQNEAAFISVKAFKDTASRCASLRKGEMVCVEGRMKQEDWERDGKKHSRLVLNASRVQFDRQSAQAGENPANGQETRSAHNAASSFDQTKEDNCEIPF